MIKFENSYVLLPKIFFSYSSPSFFKSPKLIEINYELAEDLGFNCQNLSKQELADIFSGQKKLPGSEFLSTVYAAHQFGHFVPILGDGRAILVGEVLLKNGLRYDIQLKGAGPTAYSRRGDGFSALGPVLREYVLSEFMHTMKIPTTRALAAVASNEVVYRENILPGGIFTRVARGHIRIGTFQYFAAQNDVENLKILLQYSIDRHYPEITFETKDTKEYAKIFLRKVIRAQVDLVSAWMSLGFIHGVMNTDNMNISGETIDYGPCAFMDYFNYNQVYSFIDRNGRYSYINQPNILEWNLAKLGDCLVLIIKDDYKTDHESAKRFIEEELNLIKPHFEIAFYEKFSLKLGLEEVNLSPVAKTQLVSGLLAILQNKNLDFTTSFRQLSKGLIDGQLDGELSDFFKTWYEVLKNNNVDIQRTAKKMDQVNPLYIPRNHLIEKLIAAGLKSDFSLFYDLNKVLKNPFVENSKYQDYAHPPSAKEIITNTYCGT